MMKNYIFKPTPVFLACLLIAGGAHAQTIRFSGDTYPTGDMEGRQEFKEVVTIGSFDAGTLDINGGVFNHPARSSISETIDSHATVNVSNNGQWITGTMRSGQKGLSVFNLQNGGKISSAHTYWGNGQGGTTIVTVDGPGSEWTIPIEHNSDFWIGNQGGSAVLRILNGGTVATTSDIAAVLSTGSSASIEIDGPNSSLSARDKCGFGVSAPIMMKITNGGLLSCGRESIVNWGHISLSGLGSKWIVQSDLDIGRRYGSSQAALDIGQGSEVYVAGAFNMALSKTTTTTGSASLNIEGTTAPGVLNTNNIFLGTYSDNSVNLKHSDTSGNYRLSPSISGKGNINVSGGGTTVLTGNNSYSGHTTVQSGILRAGSTTALSKDSYYVVRQAGVLDFNGHNSDVLRIFNAGTVRLGASNTSDVLTTTYGYHGYGGALHLNAALGGNTSATQKMVVAWDVSGTSTLHIRNLGGTGAQTTGNGILVVQAGSNSTGQFTLPAPGYIQAGAYRYTLHKVGRNWYLQSAPANAKAAAADDSAACVTDPLAQGCALAPGQGAVAKALPAALKAGTANAAAAAEAAAPAADDSAQLEAALGAEDLKDDGAVGFTGAVPVPGLGMVGMVSLSSLIGVAGLRRGRKAV